MYDARLFKTEDTKPKVNKQFVTLKPSNLPKFGYLMTSVKQIDEWWEEDWNKGFKVDVDYNFEDSNFLRFSILCFHYAHKELITIAKGHYIPQRGLMYDGQGWTPFHTFID